MGILPSQFANPLQHNRVVGWVPIYRTLAYCTKSRKTSQIALSKQDKLGNSLPQTAITEAGYREGTSLAVASINAIKRRPQLLILDDFSRNQFGMTILAADTPANRLIPIHLCLKSLL
jgi:hypothetical protein